MTLLCSSPCICRLSLACILRETSTKPLGMLTHFLTALLPSSHCLLLLTVSFSGQLSQADCSFLPSFVNCLSLSFLGSSFPPSLLVSREALCVGFAPKQTTRFSDRRTHTHQHNEWPTQCHNSRNYYFYVGYWKIATEVKFVFVNHERRRLLKLQGKITDCRFGLE